MLFTRRGESQPPFEDGSHVRGRRLLLPCHGEPREGQSITGGPLHVHLRRLDGRASLLRNRR